jgi:hypothetical protein
MSHLPPKSKFTPHEDILLTESVHVHGTSNWLIVASAVPGRNARQCRERWTNYVNPDLTQMEWTERDNAILMESFERFGPKWHRITTFFPGRAKNNVRNHFFGIQRRKLREQAAQSCEIPEDVAEIPSEPITARVAKDPLAFLDTIDQNHAFCWQSDQDTKPSFDSYFLI